MDATGLLFGVDDAVLNPARRVGAEPGGQPLGAGSDPGGGVGVVGSAAGPAERGGRGRPARAAPDRPGRLPRRSVLPSAGGDLARRGNFRSDRALLADPATTALRGTNALPSVSTSWRFLAGADLGRVAKAAAANRVMLRRAWAAGAAPEGDRLTIDPDATRVASTARASRAAPSPGPGRPRGPRWSGCGERRGCAGATRSRRCGQRRPRRWAASSTSAWPPVPTGARDRYRLWTNVVK